MSARRGQGGYTLIELLLVVGVSAALLVPLSVWTLLALGQQQVTKDGLLRVAGTGLLASYLPGDIATAGVAAIDEAMADSVNLNFEDCRDGDGDGGRRVLVLGRGGPTPTKIVYSEAPLGDGSDPSKVSVWRRECDAATGLQTEAAELLVEVEPGSTVATCPVSVEAPCRQIELRSRATGQSADVSVVGVRRVDAASLGYLVSGNRVPVPKIDVVSQSVRWPYQVTFSSARSFDPDDPDGQIVCFDWVFPTAAEGREPSPPEQVSVETPIVVDPDDPPPPTSSCPNGPGPPGTPGPGGPMEQVRTFPTSGVYYIELTVTDDRGLSSTTYKRVEIVPPDPVAAARISSVGGGNVAGLSVFEFAARWFSQEDGEEIGSEAADPESPIVSYEWVITADAGGPDSTFIARRATPDAWYLALPDELVGSVTVVLTVFDAFGRTNSTVSSLQLSAPDPPLSVVGPEPPPGVHPAPLNVRVADSAGDGTALLVWDEAPSVERYRVEFAYAGPGCARSLVRVIDAGPAPSQPLMPNLCEEQPATTAQVRVGAEFEGTIVWSTWTPLALPAFWAPPAGEESLEPPPPPEEP